MKCFKLKIEENIVEKSTAIFEKLGLTFESAINLFLNQAILQNGLPFSLTIPENKENSSNEESNANFEDKLLALKSDFEKQISTITQKYEQLAKETENEKLSIESDLKSKLEELKANLREANKKTEKTEEENTQEIEKIRTSLSVLRTKLSEAHQKTKVEVQDSKETEQIEKIRESLATLKSKLIESNKNFKENSDNDEELLKKQKEYEEKMKTLSANSEQDNSKLQQALNETRNRISENFQKAKAENSEIQNSSLSESLAQVRNNLAQNFQKAKEEKTDADNESLAIKNYIQDLKNKLSSNQNSTPSTSEPSLQDRLDALVADKVKQNEQLVAQARAEAGLQDGEYLTSNSQPEQTQQPQTQNEESEVPTVSSIIDEQNKSQEQDVKADVRDSTAQNTEQAHEEDEDETTPTNMFDSWGDEEEIGCGN